MKTLTAIILISSMAFSQTKCVIDPDEVELSKFGKIQTQDEIKFQLSETGTENDLISFSWLKVDSIFHNGKPDCIHEWRENKPDYSKIRYIKRQSDTIKMELKNYTRICAKCIRREAVREESVTRTRNINKKD